MKGELLATGRFRVDRRRALQKMERFQLADPLAYTLELVAAAVCAGASAIHVENDSDDFALRWEGEAPTRDELDGLFDHLFARAPEGRARALQHLALGVLGALGQAPRWVRVDRAAHAGEPALRLAVADPAETRAEEHAHDVVGTRVHVRQKVSFANLAEALLLGVHGAPEERLLRARARWCPVPLLLNGAPLAAPTPKAPLATWSADGCALWLVAAPDGAVDLVRSGVVVGSRGRRIGDVAVTGWLRADGVTLDASRANVVDDDQLAAADRALDDAVERLLHAAATATAPHADAALWLARAGRPLGPYAGLPLLTDLGGRAWTVADLGAFDGKKGTVDDPALAEPGFVLFGPAARALLDLLLPGLPDLGPVLRERAEGRARRRQARRLLPHFGPARERRFEEGPLRGAVRFEEGGGTTMRVSMRVDGAEVEQVEVPSPAGRMAAILDHPGFRTDEAFRVVLDDDTRKAALARATDEAAHFAVDHLHQNTRGFPRPPASFVVLTEALRAAGAKARTDLTTLLAPDHPLMSAPGLPTAAGRWISATQALAGEWIVVEDAPALCPPELAAQVLVLPGDDGRAWLGWLGPRARDGRATLAEEIRGAQRRAGPRQVARLADADRVRPIPGGELGLGKAGGVTVLRDGVPVCDLTPDLGLPGAVVIVDDPGLAVNLAHDALAPGVAERLVARLLPDVDALARDLWDEAPATPARAVDGRVLSWALARGDDLPAWARERPIAFTLGGAELTLPALRARAQDKRAPRLKLLTRAPVDPTAFEGAVVVPKAVAARLGDAFGRAVVVADVELADAERALNSFCARPPPGLPPALATLEETRGGVRCRWILPADPDAIGLLKLEARWRDRVVSSWTRGESLGLLGVVDGDAVRPNAAFTMTRDPNVLSAWTKPARARLAEFVARALDAGDVDRAPLRALLARLDAAADRSGAETDVRARLTTLPLFRRLDGALVSQADVLGSGTPAAWLPPLHPPGPTDHPWYLLEEPWVRRALPQLVDGKAALEDWRAGEARRRALAVREATIDAPVLARAPLRAAGLTGEVGLVEVGEGLVVTPLVDGRALDDLTLPFPAPAIAIVTGADVLPDRAFRAWREPSAAARAALLDAVAALAAAAPATPATLRWRARYALAVKDGAPWAMPVFPLLGGGVASAKELATRAAVGVVDPATREPFVAGPPPVLADAPLRDALAARFRVVDLAAVVDLHRHRPPPATPRHAQDVPGGRLAWDLARDEVAVMRAGVVLGALAPDGVVPLVGYIDAPDVDVDATWTALAPGPALDALRTRLVALSRRVLDDLLDHPDRAALLVALGRAVRDAPDEAALRVRAGRLLAAPLFTDSTGAEGTFEDVIARSPVRFVAPGVRGTPLPGRSRVWGLTQPERALVGKLRPVVDATDSLAAETRGATRRAAGSSRPPEPPPGAVRLAAPLEGALWLEPPPGSGVRVRVAGAVVERLDTPAAGLCGWVEGPFETDDAFTTARLDVGTKAALREATATLLRQEGPEGARARVPDAALSHPLSPWADVPIFTDTRDEPLTLADVQRLQKSWKRVLVGRAGATAGRKNERVVLGDAGTRALLARWGFDVEELAEVEARRTARKQAEAERKSAGAKERAEREMIAAARASWRAWSPDDPPPPGALEAVVAAWAARGRDGWPPLPDAPEEPWAALVVLAADTHPDAPGRLARVEGVVAALDGRSR